MNVDWSRPRKYLHKSFADDVPYSAVIFTPYCPSTFLPVCPLRAMGIMATLVVRPQEPVTLAIKAQTCIACFQRCLQKAALVHPRELSMVEDQLGRFTLWTGSMRVFGSSRQSLDHRLREAPDVQDTFVALLEAISYRINKCKFALIVL